MTTEEFETFRHGAVHELMQLVESCKHEFKISTYPRWDYDFDSGTLTFSQDGVAKVVASIEVVGTISDAANTWLWSWANASLPPLVTSSMKKVKSFGETEGIPLLTNATAENDEYLGWAMTGVTAKILGARGAYRCLGKNGFIYLIYKDISFADLPHKKQDQRISCTHHENGYATYICEHLLANPEQMWFSDDPSETNRWPDAWCTACDTVFMEEKQWDGKNESKQKITVICHHCYEDMRARMTR